MENPCLKCLVRAACSERCNTYAEWILDNGKYPSGLASSIRCMKYKQAVKFILNWENTILHTERN